MMKKENTASDERNIRIEDWNYSLEWRPWDVIDVIEVSTSADAAREQVYHVKRKRKREKCLKSELPVNRYKYLLTREKRWMELVS